MFPIDNTTASTTLPTPKPVGQPGYFTTGTIGGQAATIVEADWLNQVQEELLNILAADNLNPVKGTNNQVITAILDLIRRNTRQRLSGAFDIYVATTGSDTNNGLTPSTPFATLQAAWNFIMASLDCGNNTITVHIAPGTYAYVVCEGLPMGGGLVTFHGDTVNPGNVIIQSSTPNYSCFTTVSTILCVEGVTMQTTGNQLSHGIVANGGLVYISGPVIFGPCTGAHILADAGGLVQIDVSYAVNGGAYAHMFASSNGQVNQPAIPAANIVVTLAGTPAFTAAFALGDTNGVHYFNPTSFAFSGPATGKKYQATTGAQIRVAGGGPNYFPGSIAGTADAASYGAYSG